MRLDFTKCHGSGNDFALVDARNSALADWSGVARALADRAGPVGSDGLLLLTAGDDAHAFGMRMFNSDGSEAETCLNGLRCVARAGFEALGIERAQVRLKTTSAAVALDAPLSAGVVTICETAGPADLDVPRWPMTIGVERVVDAPVPPLATRRRFTAVAMPNPHLIAFVEAVDDDELSAIGRVCEAAPEWLPNRANVSFVELRPAGLFVRTFERGVGLTDSCGSAMAAATVAACLTGRRDPNEELTIFNRGGFVRGEATREGMVRLSGNATVEWRGTATIDPATGTASDLVVSEEYPAERSAWAAVRDAAG